MAEAMGYILRISTKEWVSQVFDNAMYFTSARRKWEPEQTTLFLHRTATGDAFVGYGVIGIIYGKDELSEEERRLCEKCGWKKAIEFKYVVEFEKPLPIENTTLRGTKLRGKYLHGLRLSKNQLDSIIDQAESLSSLASEAQ